ncbi:LodA/GoxA family CTQ-dependent oxidase, partial [Streptomyces hirsutus]|uniref:LodA/GoxA family CTQ-dependent oxidase n=1 Tax=Streptomyces hirsutus TaxID=35620 RepID=UPI0033F91411
MPMFGSARPTERLPMDQQIVQVKIHPAIGVARVGNSSAAPFIGPESPHQKPLPPG